MDPEEEIETPAETLIVNVDPDDGSESGGDTVVVVPDSSSSESDSLDAVTVATEIDHEGRLAALEAENAQLREQIASAQVDATIAQYTADDALAAAQEAEEEAEEGDEEVAEAVDETIDEVIDEVNDGKDGDDEEIIPDDEITPVSARVHPLFRSFSDWKSGK